MKILHLSDTHLMAATIGFMTSLMPTWSFIPATSVWLGQREAPDFLNWFCDLPHKHNIFICGNSLSISVEKDYHFRLLQRFFAMFITIYLV